MWKIIQEILPALIIILLITQYVIPVLFNTKTWWLFRSNNKTSDKPITPSSLKDEIVATKTYVDETKLKVNEVIEKVEGNLKSAEDLKKEADKLK